MTESLLRRDSAYA